MIIPFINIMSIFSTDTLPKYEVLLITDLIEDFESGKLFIPKYQRDYVWTKSDQEAFLQSIISKNVLPSIVNLIEDFESGKLFIPKYQRDYVWTKSDQEAFLQSIISKNVLPSIVINTRRS